MAEQAPAFQKPVPERLAGRSLSPVGAVAAGGGVDVAGLVDRPGVAGATVGGGPERLADDSPEAALLVNSGDSLGTRVDSGTSAS